MGQGDERVGLKCHSSKRESKALGINGIQGRMRRSLKGKSPSSSSFSSSASRTFNINVTVLKQLRDLRRFGENFVSPS